MKWKILEQLLREQGFAEEHVAIVKKVTAPIRHQQRVNRVLQLVFDRLRMDDPEKKRLGAKWLLDEEVEGLYGGGWQAPGAANLRHPFLQEVPAPRSQTGDVWQAAIEEARHHIALAYEVMYNPLRAVSGRIVVLADEVFSLNAQETILRRRLLKLARELAEGRQIDQAKAILANLDVVAARMGTVSPFDVPVGTDSAA